MRLLIVLSVLACRLAAGTDTPAHQTWVGLKAKRDKFPGIHQEFEITRMFQTAHDSHSSKSQMIVDISGEQWREESLGGSGHIITIFDGNDTLSTEEGIAEYVRVKNRFKDEDKLPKPYDTSDLDWSKAIELERRPCGIPKVEHECVVLDIPYQPWARVHSSDETTNLRQGSKRMVLDTQTGMLLSARTDRVLDNTRNSYRSVVTYLLKRMTYGLPEEKTLFRLPAGDMKEVKQLSP